MTDANITNIIGTGNWSADYSYHKNGDMSLRTIQSNTDTFTYTGNLMATLDGTNLNWDENGQITAGASAETLSYNWDGKLRSAAKAGTTINLKYDPAGNRIYKNSGGTARKYIVDIVGGLPVILVELEGSSVKKKYVYANSQILSQYDSDTSSWYYYLHDRLGSVRQLIKYVSPNVDVVKLYTFDPFGNTLEKLEDDSNMKNPWRFTGQYLDDEIGEYYLRARQYDPHISRFTSRDPVAGKFEEPLTLHRYLYCGNDPVNMIDPAGLWGTPIHNQIIMAAFPEFMVVSPPDNPYEDMFSGSAWVDNPLHQTAEYAYMHTMTNAKTNQSVEEAQRQMWSFVWGSYDLYKRYKNLGKEQNAYYYLGRALHPIMDSTCPAHNWEPWAFSVDYIWGHDDPKTIDEIKLTDTVWLIQYTMKQLDAYYELSQIQMLANY